MFYSMAGYFFDSIFSNVTSYLVPLVFTLSFLVTPKADPQDKNTFCILILLFS